MDKTKIYQQLATALEDLSKKYSIPQQELEPIAKLCGQAIAAKDMEGKEQPPMDTGDEELVGALGGR